LLVRCDAYSPLFVSDITIFVLKRDVKLQLTNYCRLLACHKTSLVTVSCTLGIFAVNIPLWNRKLRRNRIPPVRLTIVLGTNLTVLST